MLLDWLTSKDKTQAWLAGQLGLSNAQTSRVVRGSHAASWEVAERLRQLSGGMVTPNDLHEQRRRWLDARGLLLEQNTNFVPCATPERRAAA